MRRTELALCQSPLKKCRYAVVEPLSAVTVHTWPGMHSSCNCHTKKRPKKGLHQCQEADLNRRHEDFQSSPLKK